VQFHDLATDRTTVERYGSVEINQLTERHDLAQSQGAPVRCWSQRRSWDLVS
jgi:hypothetical protein